MTYVIRRENMLGIDAGNNEVKVMGSYGPDKFVSYLGEWRERKVGVEHFEKDDMEWEYNGKRGFASTLAERESEFKRSMMGETKAHEDAKLRVLLALHRYSNQQEHKIVVGQPIERHDPEEKQAIKDMLQGRHELTVNGVRKIIIIRRVEVAAEGAASFWCEPVNGLIRILDCGSGTINGATINNKRYIDKETFGLNYGLNTNKSVNLDAMSEAIITKAHKWNKGDHIRLVGGAAEQLAPYLKKHFPNLEVFYPTIKLGDRLREVHPVYANAIGFYEIARNVFQ